MANKLRCDVGIVIALEEELEQLLPHSKYESRWDDKAEEYFYYFSIGLGNRAYNCVAIFVAGMGPEKAALGCERLLATHAPATVVSIGIAGALDSDIQLGDVVVATQVDGYHQDIRVTQGDEGGLGFDVSREVIPASRVLVKHARNFKLAHAEQFEAWKRAAIERWDSTLSSDDRTKLGLMGVDAAGARIHVGHLASGPVVVSAEQFSQWLLKLDRKYMAVEMEAYGVLQSAFEKAPATLVVRGISDYSDSRKKKLDSIKRGALRRIAMQNAAALLSALADAALLKYSEISKDRAHWKIKLDGTVPDDRRLETLMAELRKLNLDDMSISLTNVSAGSVVLNLSSAPAASARVQTLFALQTLRDIGGLPILGVEVDNKFDIKKDILENTGLSLEAGKDISELRAMASARYNSGEFKIARVLFEKILFLERAKSPFNPDAVETLANLAQAYRRLGDLAEAKRLLDIAIRARRDARETHSGDDLAILAARSNRVELWTALGRPEEAVLEGREVLRSQKALLPADHPDCLRTQNNLAEALRVLGRIEEALRLHFATLEARLRKGGRRDSDTNVSMWNLLLCYDALGEHNDVDRLFMQLRWLLDRDPRLLTVDQRDVCLRMMAFRRS